MSIKYLSSSGLTEVWSNIKTYIASKIPSKIITGLSIKGRTITYTNSDGTTGTLTTQDTDTTYTSMSAAEATTGTATTARSISAKVLHDKITSITNTKANDSNVVHKSGTETISGTKTFTNQMYLGTGGTGYGQISACDTNGILRLYGGTRPANGANLDLNGENLNDGCFAIRARTTDKIVALEGKTNGVLTWGGKVIAIDDNVVHKSGNETIAGLKTFNFWQTINSGLNVRWITGNKEQQSLYIWGSMDDEYRGLGAHLELHGDDEHFGTFVLNARDRTVAKLKQLIGSPDGTLTWDGKTVLTAGNGMTVDTNQTITGAKTFALWTFFSSGLTGSWITGNKEQKALYLFASVDDSYRGYGAELQLHTETLNGGFNLIARDKTGTNIKYLAGDSNGSLTWNGANIVRTVNGVGANQAGNVTISTVANATKATKADTATKATQDSAGQQINTTYIKGVSFSGRTFTFTRGNDTTFAITIHDNVVINTLANSFGSTGVGGICFVSGRTKNNIGGFGADVAGSDIHLVHSLGFDVSTTGTGSNVIIENDYDSSLYGTWRLLGSVSLGPVNHGNGNAYAYKRWTLAIRIA